MLALQTVPPGERLMTIGRHNPPTAPLPAGRHSHVTVHPLGMS
jgi:hypothetical protein